MLSLHYLKSILDYNPMTGLFKWLIDIGNGINANDTAGTLHSNGYVYITIDGKMYRAHRLAWFYYYENDAPTEIDHKNRIRNDNRIDNLRLITHINNLRNTNLYSNNTSTVTGVVFEKSRNKWRAQIIVNKKTYNLGRFIEFDDAVCCRLATEQCLNWTDTSAEYYVKNNIQLK